MPFVSTQNQIKKHERLQADINAYADTIRQLGNRAQRLIEEQAPMTFPPHRSPHLMGVELGRV